MKERSSSYNRFLFLLIMLIGSSCSVEKNTNLSRFYHNLTSHYNIYFNGKESFNSGMDRISAANTDDFTKIMPLFEFSNPDAVRSAASDMDRAIQKASKVISLHSMTARPERKSNKPLSDKEKELYARNDYNNWVDDSYLLLGKAQFMKHDFENSRITFLHNIRESEDPEMRAESKVWLARSYAEMGNYPESRRLLTELSNQKLPEFMRAESFLTEADVFIKEMRYGDAINPLNKALALMKGNNPKNRYTYILARLYEETGNSSLAGESYRAVLKLNPPYELEFNARINQAGVFDVEKGDKDDIERELKRLLRDVKNSEYQDQIYYALGNLSMREGNIEQALEYIKQSAAVSRANNNQKGKSFLTLAEHYFAQNDYMQSQIYYDSAVAFLDNDYPGFDEFYGRSLDLNELAGYISVVEYEDSLQYVASLPEAQREALVNGIIRDIETREKLAEASTDDRYNMGQFYENQRRFRDNVDASGNWYFYNQSALAFGRTEFRNRWGQRKLEDNWRRKNRATINSIGITDVSDSEEKSKIGEGIADIKSPGYYLKNLPLTDSLISVSNDKIAISLFNAGRIFSDRFKDNILSNEYYSDLLARYPQHPLAPQALYNLYRINESVNSSFALANKEKLVTEFPESEWARILSDPDYYNVLRTETEREESLYHLAYTEWENENINSTIELCNNALKEYPDGALAPKFMLLRAYSLAQITDERTLKEELKIITSQYPGTDESKRAGELIAYINSEIPELLEEDEKVIAAEIYSTDITGPHHFVVVIKNNSLDINRLTFDVINFNIDFHTNENYSSRGELVDNSFIMITVSTLADEFIAAEYYNGFDYNKILGNTGGAEVITFTISTSNLETLKSDKDPDRYYLFFKEHYLDTN